MLIEYIGTVFIISLWALAFNRLTQPGELLTNYMQFVHSNIKNVLLKKLMTCAWCIAGQLALWTDIVLFFNLGAGVWDIVLLLTNIPSCILIVYELSIKNI